MKGASYGKVFRNLQYLEEEKMKNRVKAFIGTVAKTTAEHALKREANSTTCIAVFQPKAPEKLKQYKSINK